MLKQIVKLIQSCNYRVEGNTIYCRDYILSDIVCLTFFETNSILESPIIDPKIGDVINLELSLIRLNSQGYYEGIKSFIERNKYIEPITEYFIEELNFYNVDSNIIIEKYRSILVFIKSVQSIAKHNYDNLGIEYSLIFTEDKSLYLPFIYDTDDIKTISYESINQLNLVAQTFEDQNSEKKLLFINELIKLLNVGPEDSRFSILLNGFDNYYERCTNSYQFYLRNFSYNKLKIELDSKALEYTQKIQGVINDAQTKLIAIPAAFVIVITALDFKEPASLKNIGTILSLFVFAYIIQLFLNNQKSSLTFIKDNIISYKETFEHNDIEKISGKFLIAEKELGKQESRLLSIQCIIWSIPILLVGLEVILIYSDLNVSNIFSLIIIILALMANC